MQHENNQLHTLVSPYCPTCSSLSVMPFLVISSSASDIIMAPLAVLYTGGYALIWPLPY